MTLRAHAALWMAGLALAWICVGAGAAGDPDGVRAGGVEPLHRAFEALLDRHAMRMEANVLRTAAELLRGLALAPLWLPIVLAGFVDGMASRRARRCGLEAAPGLSVDLGRHALVALLFAPLLWTSLGARLALLPLEAWAIATSATLAFTLSRVQGLARRS